MDDLISEFLTETAENLAALDVELVKFERDPSDKPILGSIFRMVHTIKGTCGFLGLQRLEKVAHSGENVLGKFRDGVLEVTPEAVTLILRCIDRIRLLLAGIEETGSEPEIDSSELISELDAMAAGETKPAAPAAAPAAPEPEPVADAHGPVLSDAGFPVAAELLFEVDAALSGAPAPAEEHAPAPVAVAAAVPAPAVSAPAAVPAAPVATAPAAAAPASKHVVAHEESKPAVPAAAQASGEAKDSSIAAASIRVGVDVLENLMTLVSELVLTRNQLLQMVRGRDDSEFKVPLQRLSHITSDLQDGVMKTRMQPIGNAWSKLPRIVRDLSVETGKKIDLQMTGAETELDRQVLELIKDPLTHMVRNSADHGLETPDQRRAAGKAEVGVIALKAYHEGGHIVILIADDGRGLNVDKIRAKAVANGLATEAEIDQMSERQILQFIFRAGFSTAEKITSVSGRGVGMDVVRTNIEKIGGTIELQSVAGKGTTFIIKIPLTLAIVSALVVESAKERFAIPQISVVELVRASPRSDTRIEMINSSPVLRLRDRLLPLVNLRNLLRQASSQTEASDEYFVVVTQVGAYSFGIIVDRVFDTEEIVVKPVSPILRNIPFYSGNTILGDGSVIMILDPNGIAAAAGQVQMEATENAEKRQAVGDRTAERTSFLVFRAGANEFKAVPLALVARLEEIDAVKIEQIRGRRVVQYRDHLMPLIPFDAGHQWKNEGRQPILVFSEGERTMGLVVDEIVDVVADVMKVELNGASPGLIGSAVIGGKAMDVIDVGTYLVRAFSDWFAHEQAQPVRAKAEPRQVLVVEPNTFVRDLLSVHLAGAGWRVTAAEGDADALRLTESERLFDLVIAAAQSPGVDATALARRLRANPRWSGTQIVALLDAADEEDAAHLREAGFDHCLAKSSWDGLVGELRGLLGIATDAVANDDGAEAAGSAPKVRNGGRRKAASKRANGNARLLAAE